MTTTIISAPAPEDDGGDDAKNLPGYKILGPEGRGGMATVYRALQHSLNRIVALRTVREGMSAESSAPMLRQEAAILARVQHPHVNSILDCFEHRGQTYLVLEYIAGGNLATRIKGNQQPVLAAAELVEHLARTVAHIHRCGIIHGNLKPQKILLAKVPLAAPSDLPEPMNCEVVYGIPLISGFELALDRRLQGELKEGEIRGTPKYMAPEQASGCRESIGPATDIYALGGILFELLAGRPVFEAATVHELLQKKIHSEPEPLRNLNSTVHPRLEAICQKCLQRETADRYADALDLAHALRVFAESYL